MNFISRLPKQLQKAAYIVGDDVAWSREETIQVINHLSELGLAVCRIEIWLPTRPGPTIPTPYIYAWEPDTKAYSEDLKEPSIVRWMNDQARIYVKTFEWDKKDRIHQDSTPYFNLEIWGEPD